ncbi:polycystic kidney disease protein 1-like 2 [Amblyraja radiata]|uniref:polycystic kidney disease protein 1-like 2 n=1 Tax=Amblyraja radiata TaxID=386614 RepID=UPI0014024C4E|nr:polycystic kidney disease protein 1-like 2 [Amblyraja radiata]
MDGLRCFSPRQLDTILNCAVRYGDTLWIQTKNDTGFDMIYTASVGNVVLQASTLLPGVIPIDQSSQLLIGPGRHNVTVTATNSSTEISQNLTIYLLVEISGLQTTLEPPVLKPGDNVTVQVSVSEGAPINLQFDFINSYNISTYTVESSTGILPVYTFPINQEGTFLVTVTASNFISVDQHVAGHVIVTNNLSKRSIGKDSQSGARRKRSLPENLRICTARCPIPDSDPTERLLKDLPNTEDFFTEVPTDELTQAIENVLQNFSSIAMNSSTTKGITKANTYLNFITSQPDKMTVTSQDKASDSLLTLSDKLDNLPVLKPSDIMWKLAAAKSGLYGISNLINASMTINDLDMKEKMANVSEILLKSMDKIHSSLESLIHEEDPTLIFHTDSFSMILNRYNSSELKTSNVNTSEKNPFSCTFPDTADFQDISDKYIQIRMVNYRENPLIWLEQSNVSGPMTNISLSSNGTEVKIENLSETFEIILPRSNATQSFSDTSTTFTNPILQGFHVTDTESTLVISVATEPVTSVQLYLGYEYKPNETLYEFETSFFPGNDSEANISSWVIHPEMLMGRNGTYYLTAKPLLKANVSEVNATTFTITTFSAKCLYWDEVQHFWSMQGCKVGPRTNPERIQCLCNHFSLFATSFIVLPNTVDITETVELFSKVKDNSVVVSLLAAVVGVYIILVIWARAKDRQDLVKVKKTLLADNDPFAKYFYLVKVFTGHRRGAGTTSKVVITLYGSAGCSDSHHLFDPKKPVFQQSSEDEFLLATPFPLGDLTSIRLWHNNSGSSSSWYINHVIIQDPETEQRWLFFCNCWLAVDFGEFSLDKVFPVASEAEMKDFRNLFFMKTAESFTDQHIWFSVIARPPRSSFTRVQRVSCCFSLLLCTMLTNIMFWNTAANGNEEELDGSTVTWRELIIGIESAFIIFPVNLVIVQIFRNVRPKPIKMKKMLKKSGVICDPSGCQRTPEDLMIAIKGIASCLPRKLKDAMPSLEEDIRNTDDMNKLLALIADIIQHYNEIEDSETQGTTVPDRENDSSTDSYGNVGDGDSMSRNPEENEDAEFTDSNSEKQKDQIMQHFYHYVNLLLQFVETELQQMGVKKFQNPYTQIHATDQVQKMIHFIKAAVKAEDGDDGEDDDSSSTNGEAVSGSEKQGLRQEGLPWWFVYIGWLLVFVTSAVSAFFTMLYSFDYGKEQSIQWLVSMTISFLESILIIQPVKVLLVAAFVALIIKKIERNDTEQNFNKHLLSSEDDTHDMLTHNAKRSDSTIYQPPSLKNVEELKALHMKEKKMYCLVKNIIAHVLFLVSLAIIAYGERSPHSFYLNKALNDSFTKKFNGSITVNDFYNWTEEILLPNLYGAFEGFITDGNSKLIGSPRLRQVRVKPAPCPVPTRLVDRIKECRAPYSYSDEYMLDFGNLSVYTDSSSLGSSWRYQSESQLNGYPVWGKLAVYRGGGYVAELGTEFKTASRVIKFLKDNSWVDMYTRAIFIEFTVYNANVNLFCVVTLMLEMKAIGVFLGNMEKEIIRLYHYIDGNYPSVIGAQIVFMLVVIYYMVMQGKQLKQKRLKYFWNKWNIIDVAIILCSWSAFGLYIKRAVIGPRVIEDYLQNRDRFINFYETAITDSALGYVIAFLVLLATVKFWSLLHLNPKMHLITSSMERAWGNLLGLLLIMLVLLVSYSSICNLVLGLNLSSYRTFTSAVVTMVRLQLGVFNYDEVLRSNPVLGAFIITTCVIFMTFILINVFISALLVSFSEERHNPMPSENEEIVDLLLTRLCGIVGVQRKKKRTPQSNAEVMESLL